MSRKSVLLIIVILGTFSIIATFNIRIVKATWVEGHITNDTTWKFQDSPFIVINDVIVDSNATLTIEPRVEVKFGGDFSLTILGNLSAIGTVGHEIMFTSNKLQPIAGDWKGIDFQGGHIFLDFCLIEYPDRVRLSGTGKAEIKNSKIHDTYYEGIELLDIAGVLINGTEFNSINKNPNYSSGAIRAYTCINVTVSNNAFANCMAYAIGAEYGSYLSIMSNFIENCNLRWYSAGINLFGAQNVAVDGNIVKACKGGIDIATCDNLRISNNRMYNNTYFGIGLRTGGRISNASIYCNTLYSNDKGIEATTWYYGAIEDSVRIFNNSICYNTFGIFVGSANSHIEPHYNDIYLNTFGMNVSNGATCNATYNYWGDPSGPYHVSMNPTGKGNPVNGNGVDLKFIPFLTSPQGHINQPPVAALSVDKRTVNINEIATFDASNSTDDGRIDYYLFDFGDGTNSSWTTLSAVAHKYALNGTYYATVTVMDDYGVTSTNAQLIKVQITVVPEFPSFLILPLFMIVTLIAVAIQRRKCVTGRKYSE